MKVRRARPAAPGTIQYEFLAFHEANPRVYAELVRLARRAKAAGKLRIGIKLVWERLRWDMEVEVDSGADAFTLNNNYPSRYARRIMAREPDLAGFFETRRLRA